MANIQNLIKCAKAHYRPYLKQQGEVLIHVLSLEGAEYAVPPDDRFVSFP